MGTVLDRSRIAEIKLVIAVLGKEGPCVGHSVFLSLNGHKKL